MNKNYQGYIEIGEATREVYELVSRFTRINIKTICEVGAQDGRLAIGLISCFKPEKFLAIEPEFANYQSLKKRLENIKCVKTYNYALGSQSGE